MAFPDVAVQPEYRSHVVLGLGATGLSVVRYLCKKGVIPIVMDSRNNPPGSARLALDFPDVELISGGFDCRYIVQATQIIISPGIPVSTPEVRVALDMGIEVVGDVELFAREMAQLPPKVLGITGSNGKTTVTTLVGLMAEADNKKVAVGGNIGVPVLDLLADNFDLYVLELSSFQLETTQSLNCIAATCLNISEDHMDRYHDLSAYREAKMRLYEQTHLSIFNRNDEATCPSEPGNFESFGLNEPVADGWGLRDSHLVHGETDIMPISDVGLMGNHNLSNLLAAMSLADAAGISKFAMIKVATEFTGLSHRFEKIGTYNQVIYINDSKATNVGSTAAALTGLEGFSGRVILIAGGDGKGANFKELESLLKNVEQLITLGRDGDKIAVLKEGSIKVKTMMDAVKAAMEIAEAGDLILLSPACASLDMYSNYMARGDDFRHCVETLNAL